MGLDMFLHKCKPIPDSTELEYTEIAYWRKHHNLHGLMKELFESSGGTGDFNGDELILTEEDLTLIALRVRTNSLPHTVGFFFGNNPPDKESIMHDTKAIRQAKQAIKDGYSVRYNSSW